MREKRRGTRRRALQFSRAIDFQLETHELCLTAGYNRFVFPVLFSFSSCFFFLLLNRKNVRITWCTRCPKIL